LNLADNLPDVFDLFLTIAPFFLVLTTTSSAKVGFIGLGNMGGHMANYLLAAGIFLTFN
jgi:hypothetical protein